MYLLCVSFNLLLSVSHCVVIPLVETLFPFLIFSHHSLCLSANLRMSLPLFICLSVCLSLSLSLLHTLSVCLFVSLSVCLSLSHSLSPISSLCLTTTLSLITSASVFRCVPYIRVMQQLFLHDANQRSNTVLIEITLFKILLSLCPFLTNIILAFSSVRGKEYEIEKWLYTGDMAFTTGGAYHQYGRIVVPTDGYYYVYR